MIDDTEIIAEFLLESREQLAGIQTQLVAIEEAGENADRAMVDEVFRAVHSIKGTAGFLGFTNLGRLAHQLETVLNLIRNHELVPDAACTDVMLKASDALMAMIEDVEHSNDLDITAHLAALEAVVARELAQDGPRAASPGASGPSQASADPASAPSPADKPAPRAGKQKASSASADTEGSARPKRKRARSGASKRTGTSAGVPRRRRSSRNSSSNAAPAGDSAADASHGRQRTNDGKQATPQPDPPPQSAGTSTPPTPAASPAATASGGSVNTAAVRGAPAAETSIRVAVSVLDRLMNLAGELVLARNQLLQMVGRLDWDSLDGVAARLDQVTSELQETIMQARMQPLGTVFNKFPRVVRDLCASLQKQCILKIEGNDVELDKSIIEAISDPLTHLVRNAVDHGIEPPEHRVAAGKPAKGTIVLCASHHAGKVNISIRDDGAGIDAARLKDKAIARGLIRAEQARQMNEQEALRLVFLPGFSTAEEVTDVSGRGVGMDVVKTNIEKLGGAIEIETTVGGGTAFHITLPLTLAIVPSLIVSAGGRRFAIPQAGIRELVRVRAREVPARLRWADGAEELELRGELVPLVRLAGALGIEEANADAASGQHHADSAESRATAIVIVETGPLRYGLVVDGLHDSEEIVVKPLGRHIQRCPLLAGATILGDGTVAMILDISGIAVHGRLALPGPDDIETAAKVDTALSRERQTMLLFRNNPAEYFGVPMELIARVERIRSQRIECIGDTLVMQYNGTSLPLLRLEDLIKARAAPSTEMCYVAVFQTHGREIGLILPQLIDIREVSTDVDMLTFAEPGVLGAVEVDGAAVRLLDLYALVQLARPDWLADQPAAPASEGERPRILLAEDSGFFRKQLAAFLSSAGYEVVPCEDGQIAWETLQAEGAHFDLVVTDLEMPNLDGLELTRRIKGDPVWGHLPVIAVTSLASDDDIARGRDAGIDHYLVKLDREMLLQVVARYAMAGPDGAEDRANGAGSRNQLSNREDDGPAGPRGQQGRTRSGPAGASPRRQTPREPKLETLATGSNTG